MKSILKVFAFAVCIFFAGIKVQGQVSSPDYTKQKTVHMVASAHLDTQWKWTVQTTINNYLLNTLNDNFTLLEKYPDYVFNFEGALRYM